jgi:hypothetical protein
MAVNLLVDFAANSAATGDDYVRKSNAVKDTSPLWYV